MRVNRTKYTILGLLTLRPMSGYDIKSYIDTTIRHFWSESYGQIYTSLKQLEEEGWVRGTAVQGEPRSKTVYHLTAEGREALHGWLEAPPTPEVPRYEISLKLFFGAEVPARVNLEHVRRYRREQEALLEMFTSFETRMKAESDSEQGLYRWAVLRGGLLAVRYRLQWCDETEALLQEMVQVEEAADAN